MTPLRLPNLTRPDLRFAVRPRDLTHSCGLERDARPADRHFRLKGSHQ